MIIDSIILISCLVLDCFLLFFYNVIEPDEMDSSLYHRYIETSEDKLLYENYHTQLSEMSKTRNRVDSCVDSLLNFLEPFVSEAQHCKRIESSEQRWQYVVALTAALLRFLEGPVAHFDVGKVAKKIGSGELLYYYLF